MDTFFDAFGKFISGAEKLGTFSAAAVWAFFCLVFILYIFYDMRQKRISSEKALEARLEDSKADFLTASALEKLADEIKELRHSLQNHNGGPNV